MMIEHVGLFVPLPKALAAQYPPEGKAGEDDSPPHMTLLYIGDVPDERIEELHSVLSRIVQAVPPLELKLLPPTTFKNDDNQTIVHSPVSGPLLDTAHYAIRTALERRGFDVKAYDHFKPHVTIEYVDPGEQPRFGHVRPTGKWVAKSVGFWAEKDRRSLPFGKRRVHAARDCAQSAVHAASKLPLGPGKLNESNTTALQGSKLKAKNKGDFGSAVLSAGYYAKKMQKTMYLYRGNSYGHSVWRVSDKPSDYLNPINNTGSTVISVTPSLEVFYHDVRRPSTARCDVIACLLRANRPDLANVITYGAIQQSGPGDLLRSFNTLAKYNDGLWKSEKQGKFLWNWANHNQFLHGGSEAIAWAKQTGWYDPSDKKQRVLQFILLIEQFGKRDVTKIRYNGTFVLIDGTGVLAVAGFKVQHPKHGEETKPEPIAGTAKTRFVRDRNIVPPINVDPAGDAAREKAKQLKLNEPTIKAIESIPDWRGHDIFVDFHTILMGGGTLSPGQMRVIERNVPLPIMNVGTPDDLLAKMNQMDRWVEHVFIPKTSEAWKQIDEDTYQRALKEVERGYRKAPPEKENSPTRIKREWADYKAGKTKSKQGYEYLIVFHDLQDFISEALKINLYRALKGSRGLSPEDGYPAFRAVLNDALPKLKRGKPPTKTQMIWLRALLLVHDRMVGSDGKLTAWIKKRLTA